MVLSTESTIKATTLETTSAKATTTAMTSTFSATTLGVTTAGPRMSALLLGGSLGTRVISFLFFYYNKKVIFCSSLYMVKCDAG
jgi:hypothetical protein